MYTHIYIVIYMVYCVLQVTSTFTHRWNTQYRCYMCYTYASLFSRFWLPSATYSPLFPLPQHPVPDRWVLPTWRTRRRRSRCSTTPRSGWRSGSRPGKRPSLLLLLRMHKCAVLVLEAPSWNTVRGDVNASSSEVWEMGGVASGHSVLSICAHKHAHADMCTPAKSTWTHTLVHKAPAEKSHDPTRTNTTVCLVIPWCWLQFLLGGNHLYLGWWLYWTFDPTLAPQLPTSAESPAGTFSMRFFFIYYGRCPLVAVWPPPHPRECRGGAKYASCTICHFA